MAVIILLLSQLYQMMAYEGLNHVPHSANVGLVYRLTLSRHSTMRSVVWVLLHRDRIIGGYWDMGLHRETM